MRTGLKIALVLMLACLLALSAAADTVEVEERFVTVSCTGLKPDNQYSFAVLKSAEEMLTEGNIIYAGQTEADENGTFRLTFIHADLPACVFMIGGHFADGASPRVAGVYTPAAAAQTAPAALSVIGEEAFFGCSFEQVILDGQVTAIGARAFGNCASLKRIAIPDSVTDIAPDAFEGCADLTIECGRNSIAYQFAIEHQFTVSIR